MPARTDLPVMADAFGRMLLDYHRGGLSGQPVYRRDDGRAAPAHCAWYFADPAEWGAFEREGIGLVEGQVLDVGCGAGRACLWLEDRGHRALGIDASRRAVRVATERGARAVAMDAPALGIAPDAVDSALLVGTHVGACGVPDPDLGDGECPDRLRALLSVLDRVLAPGGRIVADLFDPARVEDPDLRAYLDDRRLAPGVSTRRFRLEYDGRVGPWRTLLLCSPDALRELVAPTAWTVARVHEGPGTRYFFVLQRDEEPQSGE